MIPDLTLVNHCWGYHRLLTLQLSGFVAYPPRCHVLYRPCVTLEDEATIATVEWFMQKTPATVTIVPLVMARRELMRREIGRNVCAKASQSPIVGFIDTDYVYGPGDLDTLVEKYPEGCKLAHPGHVYATTHPRGMEMIQSITEPRVVEFDLAVDFPVVQRLSVAIGGVQFIAGSWCREKGYCGDEVGGRRMGPASRWCGTKGDRKIRYKIGEDQRLKGPLFYRVRHSIRSEGHSEDARL